MRPLNYRFKLQSPHHRPATSLAAFNLSELLNFRKVDYPGEKYADVPAAALQVKKNRTWRNKKDARTSQPFLLAGLLLVTAG